MCYTSAVPRAEDRCYLSLWITKQGRDLIRRRATEEADGNISDMARRMLKYASLHMPEGWPDARTPTTPRQAAAQRSPAARP